jgi:hypothetical protein
VKVVVRGQAIATTITSPAKEGTFAVHASWCGKVQAGLTPTSNIQEREGEGEGEEEEEEEA